MNNLPDELLEYNDLLNRLYDEVTTAQRGVNMTTPTPQPVPPEPAFDQSATTIPPDVRVRVRWHSPTNHNARIESTHRLPAKALVLQELTPAQRSLIPMRYRNASNSYYDIRYCINHTHESIPLQVWADAISAATVRGLAVTTAVSADSIVGGLSQTGYLAIGGSILKVSTIAHVGSSKAMAAIKRHATEQAKAEAEAIRTVATQWATNHRADAEQAASTIIQNANLTKAEAAKLMLAAQRTANVRPPEWLLEAPRSGNTAIPFKLDASSRWCVGITLALRPNHFEYTAPYRDDAGHDRRGRLSYAGEPSEHDPLKVFIWQPLDTPEGTYNPRHAYIDNTINTITRLPHMHTSGSCLGLSDGPPLLNSHTAYANLRNSLQRVHNGVNFASLLTEAHIWMKYFKPWIPAELWTLMQGTWQQNMMERIRELNTPINVERENAGVWTA
jgi:hypothetical protein